VKVKVTPPQLTVFELSNTCKSHYSRTLSKHNCPDLTSWIDDVIMTIQTGRFADPSNVSQK